MSLLTTTAAMPVEPHGDDLAKASPPSLPAAAGAKSERPPNPFDPARLRIGQDFGAGLGVRKALMTVPVRKPSREWWVQVHPEEGYRLQTGILELKEDQELYLVVPELWSELSTDATFSPRALFTAINRQGVLFLWQARLPGPDGRIDEWSRSALEAASMAQGRWVRTAANMSLGAYEVFTTEASIPAPVWPTIPFEQILRVAFKDRLIDSLDHHVLKRLRGEA